MTEPKFTHSVLEDGTKVVTLVKAPKQAEKEQPEKKAEPVNK